MIIPILTTIIFQHNENLRVVDLLKSAPTGKVETAVINFKANNAFGDVYARSAKTVSFNNEDQHALKPNSAGWKLKTRSEQIAYRDSLIALVKPSLKDFNLMLFPWNSEGKNAKEGDKIWREKVSFKEKINGIQNASNYTDFEIDYQTGQLVYAGASYATTALPIVKNWLDIEIDSRIAQDGTYTDKKKTLVYFGYNVVFPLKSSKEHALHVTLATCVNVKRGKKTDIYLFDQDGMCQKNPSFLMFVQPGKIIP